MRTQDLERENTELKISIVRKDRTIVLLSAVIGLMVIVFVARVVVLVKTGGWSGLLRRLFFGGG